MAGDLANWKIATYALHLLGGATQPVHTEDVALKCFGIAPDVFSWVKHTEYPDKDIVRSALMDARKAKNGALVMGRSGRGGGHRSCEPAHMGADGWQLTHAGIRWLTENEQVLAEALGQRPVKRDRQATLKRLSRITGHPLFAQFCDQPQGFAPSLGEMADMLRCRVDADLQIWHKRIETFRNLAQLAQDTKVMDFLHCCEAAIRTERDKS